MKQNLYVVPVLYFIHADSADNADTVARDLIDRTPACKDKLCLAFDESRATALYQMPAHPDMDICLHYDQATEPYGDDRLRAATDLLAEPIFATFEKPGVTDLFMHGRTFRFTVAAAPDGPARVTYTHTMWANAAANCIPGKRELLLTHETEATDIAEWISREVELFHPDHLLRTALSSIANFNQVFTADYSDPTDREAWEVLLEVVADRKPATTA